jgi:hypothetical protein
MQTASLILIVFLAHSNLAVAQNTVYRLPTASNLDELSPAQLAASLRELNQSFIDVLPQIRQGRMVRTLRDGGRVSEVTSKNAAYWEIKFMERRGALIDAARKKGLRNVAGDYSVRMTPDNCILPSPAPTEALIGQAGHEITVYFSPYSKLSGTIVQDAIDLPLYGGTQPNPYFTSIVTGESINLTNASSCQVSLIKKRTS